MILLILLIICAFCLVTRMMVVQITLRSPFKEGFSSSGLTMSNEECDKLANVYYKPGESGFDCKRRICAKNRRNSVDFVTGNYFTENGVLV